MDLKNIEYIVEIAKNQGISKAAAKLFITQSALSQYLQKTEEEVGVPLFNRVRNSWTLTSAGQIYVETAKNILEQWHQAEKNIQNLKDCKTGHLIVGINPERGIHIFSEFQKRYPLINLEVVDSTSTTIAELTASGKIDIALLQMIQKDPRLTAIGLSTEDIVLAVPNRYPPAQLAERHFLNNLTSIDLDLVRDIPFSIQKKGTLIRELLDDYFQQTGFHPKAVFETESNNAIFALVKGGVSAAFLPLRYAKNLEDAAFFALTPRISWTTAVAWRTKSYLSEAERYLIYLLQTRLIW